MSDYNKELNDYFTEVSSNICKMQTVQRRIYTAENRNENDAEHTYGMMAIFQALRPLLLQEYNYDVIKVYDMILLHDFPEVISGDVWYRDEEGRKDKSTRERKAAESIMTDWQLALWHEYESRLSAEAILVKKIDILQAVTSIVNAKGLTWKNNKVTREQEMNFSKWILEQDDVISKILRNLFDVATDSNMFYDSSEIV